MHPRVVELLGRPQWAQRTPEWFERRKTLMTASDAAGALGIPAWDGQAPGESVRRALLAQKVGGTFKGNMYTRHGQDHEDLIRDKVAAIVGDEALDFGLLVHPELPWLGASPDGIFASSGLMIEIKAPYKRRIVPGEVPHHYMPQIQCQLEVCGLDACLFCEWKPPHLSETGLEILNIVTVSRDPAWFEKHRGALHDFWRDLMHARAVYVPPPPPTTRIIDGLYE